MKCRYQILLLLLLVIGVQQVLAQSGRRRTTTAADYFGTGTTTTSDTVKKKTTTTTQTSTRSTSSSSNTNVPVEVVPTRSGNNPLFDTIKRSLRSVDAIERNLIRDQKPLDYEHIREDDAIFRHRVWRVIDTREKMNLSFRNASVEDGASQLFIAILYRAVTEGGITAFKDEYFVEPLTVDGFKMKFSGGLDTINEYDLEGNVVKKQVRQREFMVDSVLEYQIKEEWIFDKETSRMFTRIVGIAPMMKVYTSEGMPITADAYPMFWLAYPDMRSLFAQQEVYNPKNFSAKMTWSELFEKRYFSSRIVKSTLNNPLGLPLKAYISDPLFQLLEGEKIKQKIFDYEQNLWAY